MTKHNSNRLRYNIRVIGLRSGTCKRIFHAIRRSIRLAQLFIFGLGTRRSGEDTADPAGGTWERGPRERESMTTRTIHVEHGNLASQVWMLQAGREVAPARIYAA